jgi:hypothetical protein
MAGRQRPLFDSTEQPEPVVLLVGTVDREGVLSAVKASGGRYTIKRIDSSAENWGTICEIFNQERVSCALLKLTTTTYDHLANMEYASARERLLTEVAKAPHIVFVHEHILTGPAATDPSRTPPAYDDSFAMSETYDVGHSFALPSDECRQLVNSILSRHKLQVIPYRTNAELTTLASAFIAEVEQGLVFRVYVPSRRMWAHETDRLLTLFRDYLATVGHDNVTLQQRRTTHGIVYEFFAPGHSERKTTLNGSTLSAEFGEFSELLDLCVTDPTKAHQFLANKHLNAGQITTVLTRFSKEAKRLHVDLRQEREQKLLSIRHRLESELADIEPNIVGTEILARLVDTAVPPISGIGAALTGEHRSLYLVAGDGGGVTINVSPQIIHSVNTVVAQEIEGDVHLTNQDQDILQLVRQHAPEQHLELATSIREIADDSAPKAARLSARQRLKAFLSGLGGKVPDIALNLLQAYLEKRLGF